MERVKNIVQKILSERRFLLKEVNFDYKMKSGEWVEKNWEIFDRGDGAAILLYDTDKRVILLSKQFRMPTKLNGNDSGFILEVPAGIIDENETPEEAIIRETREETGYEIEEPDLVHQFYSSPGAMTEKNYGFVKRVVDTMQVSKGGGLETELEDIEILEIPFSEVGSLIADGKITDSKTLILLQHAIINGLLE